MATVETKNFALTRKCQVKGVLSNPNGNGAFIRKLPVNQIEPCESCKGTGVDNVCRSCKNEAIAGEVFVQGRIVKCTTCKGTGKVTGQDCSYCKGTKRSYPPHHYVEVDRDGDIVISDDEPDTSEKLNDLRMQIEELGGAYHHASGVEKLEHELVILKKVKGVT